MFDPLNLNPYGGGLFILLKCIVRSDRISLLRNEKKFLFGGCLHLFARDGRFEEF